MARRANPQSVIVMAGPVPAIRVFLAAVPKHVDARVKPGHDELLWRAEAWLRRIPLIRRNLDQAAVGIPAIDRPQRAAGAMFPDRTLLDRHAARLQMRDHLVRRARGEKAQIVTACGFMIRGEPLDLVGIARPHVDFLVAEDQRCPGGLAGARIEHGDLHAEDPLVPLRRARHVGHIDHERSIALTLTDMAYPLVAVLYAFAALAV